MNQYSQQNTSSSNTSHQKTSNQNRYNTNNNYSASQSNANNQQNIYNRMQNSEKNNNDYDILNDIYGNNFNRKNSNTASTQASDTNTPDFLSLFSSFFQNNANSNSINPNNDFNMPDMETMLKFKKIFECLNSKNSGKDPIINLLYAFKPFMQESKKSIIDQLTKFISISSVLHEFNNFL